MVWTAPMTAVSNAVFTAAEWNTFVRDNLNETAAAQTNAESQLIVTTGANMVDGRAISQGIIEAAETTTSTSFTDLATVGPRVTVTTGTRAFIALTCQMTNTNSGARAFAGFAVSGATTTAASDNTAIEWQPNNASQPARLSVYDLATLNPGDNTFTMQYRVGSQTGTFQHRRITVIGL